MMNTMKKKKSLSASFVTENSKFLPRNKIYRNHGKFKERTLIHEMRYDKEKDERQISSSEKLYDGKINLVDGSWVSKWRVLLRLRI